MLTTFVVHTVMIYAETMLYGRCLVYTLFESMTLISFTIMLMYMVVERITKERSIGLFFVLLALLFQTVSDMFAPMQSISTNEVSWLLDPKTGGYVSALIICYTVFAIGAVYSILYLILHNQISTSRFGGLFERLPSLQLLDKMNSIAIMIGLFFLLGAILMSLNWRFASALDLQFILLIIIFITYSVSLTLRKFSGVKSTTAIITSLVGFILIVASMGVRFINSN